MSNNVEIGIHACPYDEPVDVGSNTISCCFFFVGPTFVVGEPRARALIELMRNKLSSIYSCTKLLHHVFCYGAFAPNENYTLKGERRRKKNTIRIEECSMERMQAMKNVKALIYFIFLLLSFVVYFISVRCALSMPAMVSEDLYCECSQANNLMKIFRTHKEDTGVHWMKDVVDEDGALDCRRLCDSILYCTPFTLNSFIFFQSLSNLF